MGKIAVSYVSYIHVAAIFCRDPPLSTKGKARAYMKAEEKYKVILYKSRCCTCTNISG